MLKIKVIVFMAITANCLGADPIPSHRKQSKQSIPRGEVLLKGAKEKLMASVAASATLEFWSAEILTRVHPPTRVDDFSVGKGGRFFLKRSLGGNVMYYVASDGAQTLRYDPATNTYLLQDRKAKLNNWFPKEVDNPVYLLLSAMLTDAPDEYEKFLSQAVSIDVVNTQGRSSRKPNYIRIKLEKGDLHVHLSNDEGFLIDSMSWFPKQSAISKLLRVRVGGLYVRFTNWKFNENVNKSSFSCAPPIGARPSKDTFNWTKVGQKGSSSSKNKGQID